MSDAIARIGVYGGAFDPPHLAHRAVVEAALDQLDLDILLLLPTGQAWHKTRPLTDGVHRLAMCRLAFGDLARVRIDDREIRRRGPTYTIDTLREVASDHPGARLFLIIGADQLLALHTWHHWRELLEMASLAVANRAEDVGEDAMSSSHPPADLSGVDIPHVRLQMPLINVSATSLRRQLTGALPSDPPEVSPLVLPAVASYISQHNLYRPHP